MVKPIDLEVGDVFWYAPYGKAEWWQILKMSSWQQARESMKTISRLTIKNVGSGVVTETDMAKTDGEHAVCAGKKIDAIRLGTAYMKRYGEKSVWIGYKNNTQVSKTTV